jgi:hypothetical protein
MLKPMFGKAKSANKTRILKPVLPLCGAMEEMIVAGNIRAEQELDAKIQKVRAALDDIRE